MVFTAQPVLAATNSGLPIPRFVSLKNEETNVRTGPGTRYPIQWVYHRQGMPVEVVEEYDLWRKIRDMDGTTGWVHKTLIDGKRNVMIKGKGDHMVRIDSDPKSKPILKVEPMVIARVMECTHDWCRIQVTGRKGWIEKKHLWGVYSEEVFD
jgi:SH3-like domain-containing protein